MPIYKDILNIIGCQTQQSICSGPLRTMVVEDVIKEQYISPFKQTRAREGEREKERERARSLIAVHNLKRLNSNMQFV